ncbi:hypothetical protein ADL28_39675 [Streptomyces violaceusniger]|nr:hypothetical protein ADL28_39675 [Streptomyces violaceusniger]
MEPMRAQDGLVTALRARMARFKETGDASVLFEDTAHAEADTLHACLTRADASSGGVPHLPALDTLVEFLLIRYTATPGSYGFAYLGNALHLMRWRAQVRPEGVPPQFYAELESTAEKAERAAAEGKRLLEEYTRSGDSAPLDEAIDHCRCAAGLSIATAAEDGLTQRLSDLSVALGLRFRRTGSMPDLEEAIAARRQSVELCGPDHPARIRRLSILVELLLLWCRSGARPWDVDETVRLAREVVAATDCGDSYRALRLSRLAQALYYRFQDTEQLGDLDEAIEVGRRAAEALAPDDRGAYLLSLGMWLQVRHDRTGIADLKGHLQLMRRRLADASREQRPQRLSQLGTALYHLYEYNGEVAHLQEAIEAEEQALALTAEGDDQRGDRLTNLSVSYRLRYERLRSVADLDAAIQLGTEALSAPLNDSALAAASLSTAFQLRYRHTLNQADLDRGVHLGRKAVDKSEDGSPHRSAALTTYANALSWRLAESVGQRQEVDVDEAVRLTREAVATLPVHDPDRGLHLMQYSSWLRYRYTRWGDPRDLSEAVEVAEEAVAVTPNGHRYRQTLMHTLAIVLSTEVESPDGAERAVDLDRAVMVAREAVAVNGLEDTSIVTARITLGTVLKQRYRARDDATDLREAVHWWRQAAESTVGTLPDRMSACTAWGEAAVELGDLKLAVGAYTLAMELLPQLTWHGLSRPARERQMADWSGLASDAATCLVMVGQPERAIEILEQGRSVVWNQILHTRTDLSLLAERAPAQAQRLSRIRDTLDARPFDTMLPITVLSQDALLAPSMWERLVEERAALLREWDEAVAEVRRLEGFAHFLRPVPFAELARAAAEGPVVLINVSRFGSHALVVGRNGPAVEAIELPEAAWKAVSQRAETFSNIVAAGGQPHRSFLERERHRHAVHDILDWLWNHVAEPVLNFLGIWPGADPMPRVWWCPTGPLALLPLHAAGHHPRHQGAQSPADRSMPDRVVSSYTPTLAALCRARGRKGPAGPAGRLTVGMPETPGHSPLPGVEREITALDACFSNSQAPHRSLIGPQATREAVKQALTDSPWVHLACHAVQEPMNPASSGFALYDGLLTVAELSGMHLPQGELAYLSACRTATPGVRALDEAVHPAAAVQVIGYRHVVATMWNIGDSSAPDVAAATYAALLVDGRTDAAHTARALHDAVAAQRRGDPTDPLRWAAYAHYGP